MPKFIKIFLFLAFAAALSGCVTTTPVVYHHSGGGGGGGGQVSQPAQAAAVERAQEEGLARNPGETDREEDGLTVVSG